MAPRQRADRVPDPAPAPAVKRGRILQLRPWVEELERQLKANEKKARMLFGAHVGRRSA